ETMAPSASCVLSPPGSRRSVTVTCTVEPLLTWIVGPASVCMPPAIDKPRYDVVTESLQSSAESVQSLVGPSENASTSKVVLSPTSSTNTDCRGEALKYTSPWGIGLQGSIRAAACVFDQIRWTVKAPLVVSS